MRQRWTTDTIRFLRDAAANSDYYQQIARRAAACIPPEAHVCDAGCGLGELSLALLPYCRRVTAIDRCAAPVADLRQRLTVAQRERLEPVCGDILQMCPAEAYDAMVFCLFGSMEEIFTIVRAQCMGPAVVVKRDCACRRFTSGGRDMVHYSAREAEKRLHSLGIPYRSERLDLELGQPLRSVEDGVRFFQAYNPERNFSAEEVRSMLQAGCSEEFPYYLPNRKQLRLLTFQAEDLRRGEGRLCQKDGIF